MASTTTVTIPEVELSVDQLLAAVRQLEPRARLEIAKALVETELDVRMAELIHRRACKPATEDISDPDSATEVNAVRNQRRR